MYLFFVVVVVVVIVFNVMMQYFMFFRLTLVMKMLYEHQMFHLPEIIHIHLSDHLYISIRGHEIFSGRGQFLLIFKMVISSRRLLLIKYLVRVSTEYNADCRNEDTNSPTEYTVSCSFYSSPQMY